MRGPSAAHPETLDSRFRGNDEAAAFANVPAFVHGLAYEQLPADVVASATRSLLDLIGIAAAGSRTQAPRIVNAYAASRPQSCDAA
jgi:2-methylcitrate dehydratase PrpD